LLVLALVACAQAASQDDEDRGPTEQEARHEMEVSYRDLMRRLQPADRDKLQKGQQAWLKFVDKNSKAMAVAAPTLGISADDLREFEINELTQRTFPFPRSRFSSDGDYRKADFDGADKDLNAVYKRCIAAVTETAQAALRDAQRAWIEYRDAHRDAGVDFTTRLTLRRAEQLNQFYIRASIPATRVSKADKPPVDAADPFERAKK
jgi:uncharacterized protein YecT (DUF1311 family)